MNYKEARVYLDDLSKYGSVLGLESMNALLARIGSPQNNLKYIHIAGTNGKGSVLAYLSTVLSGAGYRTGSYLSPTLFSYRERIQVNGASIDRSSLARLVTQIAEACRSMTACGMAHPTAFEVETALAFLYFKEQGCQLVVLEAGLGGALDATNVIPAPVLSILTSISMDHTAFLGDTLSAIAAQKCGIIKPGSRVVSAAQPAEAAAVIGQACREKGCPLTVLSEGEISDVRYGLSSQQFSFREWKDISISLAGNYQIPNAALALLAATELSLCGFPLTESQIRTGLRTASWPGRFTVLRTHPAVILDGAHNPAAAKTLRDSLLTNLKGARFYYIFGVFRDKDYPSIISLTAPYAEKIFTIQTPGNPRALPADELCQAVKQVNPSACAAASIQDALKSCLRLAGAKDAIVIFGSLSFLAEAGRALEALGAAGRQINM